MAVVSNFLLGLQKCAKDNARDERMRDVAEQKAQRAKQTAASKPRPGRARPATAAQLQVWRRWWRDSSRARACVCFFLCAHGYAG